MRMHPLIYLDNNATTALDPRVLQILVDSLASSYGNPSSAHQIGQAVRHQLNQARRAIAQYLAVRPTEVIFTSSGTEGLNTVIRGLCQKSPHGHVITSSAEHACVYATLKEREQAGQPVAFLRPGPWGAVTAAQVKAALRPDTAFIALMAVNNETGVKTEVAAIAALAAERDIPFIVDGVAWLGKECIAIPPGVSAMAFSGHKLHAPKGVGCLFWSHRLKGVPPLMTGGGQEYGKRGGTENVSGIMALAEAIRLLETELPSATERMRRLRDRFEQEILAKIPGAQINGQGPRVANTANISFPGKDGESLLIALDQAGVAVSHGSACASGALEPSRVLLEMDIPPERARSAMRFSLSRFTTEAEIDQAISIVMAHIF
jgi:cysteine desulfurase